MGVPTLNSNEALNEGCTFLKTVKDLILRTAHRQPGYFVEGMKRLSESWRSSFPLIDKSISLINHPECLRHVASRLLILP